MSITLNPGSIRRAAPDFLLETLKRQFERATAALRREWESYHTRMVLRQLDDRLLKDIGLTRGATDRFLPYR